MNGILNPVRCLDNPVKHQDKTCEASKDLLAFTALKFSYYMCVIRKHSGKLSGSTSSLCCNDSFVSDKFPF